MGVDGFHVDGAPGSCVPASGEEGEVLDATELPAGLCRLSWSPGQSWGWHSKMIKSGPGMCTHLFLCTNPISEAAQSTPALALQCEMGLTAAALCWGSCWVIHSFQLCPRGAAAASHPSKQPSTPVFRGARPIPLPGLSPPCS